METPTRRLMTPHFVAEAPWLAAHGRVIGGLRPCPRGGLHGSHRPRSGVLCHQPRRWAPEPPREAMPAPSGCRFAASDHSFPVALGDKADQEAFYRLVNNEVVGLKDLVAPHRERSRGRALAGRLGLVLHDTTELSFPGETPREGLHCTGHRSVMHAHIAILVGLEEASEVHGVVGFRAYAVSDGQWREAQPGRTTRVMEVGSDRWRDAVVGARATAPAGLRLLHVMDREADDYRCGAPSSTRVTTSSSALPRTGPSSGPIISSPRCFRTPRSR